MLKFHRECWNPVKSHSKALVFFAVSKQIPVEYYHIIGEPKYKYGQQEQETVRNHNRSTTFRRDPAGPGSAVSSASDCH